LIHRHPELVAGPGSLLIRLLGLTWRIRTVDGRYLESARAMSGRVVFAFWHGRLLPLSYTYRGLRVHVLASEHPDGELMGRTIRHLGFGHVRGSSSRGGARAIFELVRLIKEGFDLGITVDGPKGPKFVVKPGPVEIAKLSGAPIVPITASSARHWAFDSWDSFEVPKPFSTVVVRYGEPVAVPAEAGPEMIEEHRRLLEERLRSITEINDTSVQDRSRRGGEC
jgi:lysophospholipid acyltransferase (LPLAT)-like uncharacterized protein